MSRHERELEIVRAKFPPGTRHEVVDGYSGWLYSFPCEYGVSYTMFAYWDGSMYKVKLVLPDPGMIPVSAHDSHYFRDDGIICLADSVGLPTLDQAFSKSVLFATAWTAFEASGYKQFPF